MTVSNVDRQATELSLAWDALLEGRDASPTSLAAGLVDTLRIVHASREPHELDKARIDQIWGNVIAGTAPLWTPNGARTVEPIVVQAGDPATAGPARRLWRGSLAVSEASAWVGRFAWVVVAGFLGGFVAGIGGRLAMRLAGYLTIDGNRYMRTENGNVVGEITLGGTVSLGMLGGAVGIGVLLIYLALRDRLPGTGWRRSALFSVLLLVVFGYVVMDPGNPDYERFGPPWLNVGTFSVLYLVMGFCVGQAYELSRRFRGKLGTTRAYRLIRIPALLISPVVALLGLLVMLAITFVAIAGVPLVALGILAWLASRLTRGWAISMPRLPAPVERWGLIAVPMLVGLVLTVRGIIEILTG